MSDEAVAAAELVAGNAAGAEASAPMAPPGGEPDKLFDKLFDGIVQAAGIEEPKPDEPPAEAKPEEKKDEAEETEPEFDDLSDDRPWTPERIKNAAAILKADKRRLGSWLHEINTKGRKIKEKQAQIKNDRQQLNLVTQRVMNDLETIRRGSPQEAAAALGRLAQTDPHRFYEDMSLAFMGKAGGPKQDPVVAELKAEVAALKEELHGRQQKNEQQQTIAAAQRDIRAVMQAADEWPHIAERAKEAPDQVAAEFWQIYERESRAAGHWLDVQAVADRIERTLRRQSMPSHRAKQNGAAGSGPDRVQETRAQSANPEPAQSPPRSLSPSLSATPGGARREPTEEERVAEFARSAPPEFFQQFGSF